MSINSSQEGNFWKERDRERERERRRERGKTSRDKR